MKQAEVILYNCPICDGDKLKGFKTIKDYSTTGEDFDLSQCSGCGFVFTNPIPSTQELGRYYDNPEYISHTNQKTGLFANAYQLARAFAIKNKIGLIRKYAPKKSHILDYGSGTGEFLNACKNAGFQVTGVELADGARISSIERYDLNVLAPQHFDSISSESLQAITMWHVLEHLPALKDFLQKAIQKLKQGGVLVLALPNRESFDAKRYKEYWAAWDVPIHFYHFTKGDINHLAELFSMEVVEIRNMPLDSFYVSLLSEKYKSGKKRWIQSIATGIVSNIKGYRNKNMSSLTYVLRKL